tara:strand:- start:777 stop:1163 length:387 start_codon:yes stop_codon:yes gene_type:complete
VLKTQTPTDIQSVTGDSGHEKCAPKKLDHTVKSFLELSIQQSPLPGQAYKDQKPGPLCGLTGMLFSRHGLSEKARDMGHREAYARPKYLFGLKVSERDSVHQGLVGFDQLKSELFLTGLPDQILSGDT